MLFGRKAKNPIFLPEKKVANWVYTTCGYCSTGCSIEVGIDHRGRAITARGVGDADVNRGKLCLKGIFEHELFNSQGRGQTPLMRDKTFQAFKPAHWDQALDQTADEVNRIQRCYGRDSFAIVSTGQLLTEEFYTLGKLARGVIGTNNYDGNTTLCMASAVSGYKRSYGSDGPPGCYEDFDHTHCLLAIGTNLPEQHPVIFWRLKQALEKRKFPVIVVDPRVTMFAQMADMHLPITPGTDVVFLNSLAHVILAEGLQDQEYLQAHVCGFSQFGKLVTEYDPITAAKICGIDEYTIRQVARLYARSEAAMTIWTMGINQSTHGSDGVVGINNLNLITGNIGKPGGTSLSITGQCNAMGTREWSSCSGLPGYRYLENEQDRQEIAQAWGCNDEFFPEKRGLYQTDIFPAIEAGLIKGLWIIATNPLTSMPNTARIRKTLEKLEFMVVQDTYADVETNEYAHVYLPAAIWAEKEGVMTNTERRVNIIRNVQKPYADSKPDLWIFNQLAKRFERGQKMKFPRSAQAVFDEMRQLSKDRFLDISGMSYEKIEQSRGLQWPLTINDDKGTARLYSDGKFQHADGKAKLIPLPFVDNNETPDDEFPLWLNSGRVVEHFHTRTRTGKIANLNKFCPTPYVEINPDTAAKLEIEHMSYVRLVSRRGDAVALAQLTHRVAGNMVFIPFHFHECVNRLTLGLLDPYSRQPAFKQCTVKIESCHHQQAAAWINKTARAY